VDWQATEWGGRIVARHLAINLTGGDPEDQKAARARVKAHLKQWVACGWLGTETKPDAHRDDRDFYKVGQWASAANDPNLDRCRAVPGTRFPDRHQPQRGQGDACRLYPDPGHRLWGPRHPGGLPQWACWLVPRLPHLRGTAP
jgi:hypothetical protein